MSTTIDDCGDPVFIQKLDTGGTQEITIPVTNNNSIDTLKRAWHYANGVLLRRRSRNNIDAESTILYDF